jgi:hypothetical protein
MRRVRERVERWLESLDYDEQTQLRDQDRQARRDRAAGEMPGLDAGPIGGGGGGSGGLILIYTLTAWTAGTTNVEGGAAGSGVGTGANGNTGAAEPS